MWFCVRIVFLISFLHFNCRNLLHICIDYCVCRKIISRHQTYSALRFSWTWIKVCEISLINFCRISRNTQRLREKKNTQKCFQKRLHSLNFLHHITCNNWTPLYCTHFSINLKIYSLLSL